MKEIINKKEQLSELKKLISVMTDKEFKQYLIDLTINEYGSLGFQFNYENIIDITIERMGGIDACKKALIKDLEDS